MYFIIVLVLIFDKLFIICAIINGKNTSIIASINLNIGPIIKSFLYYVPYVTLAVMTFPAILTATANIWSAAIGFAIALILAWNRKSLICVSLFSCAGVFLVELLTGL